MGEGSRFTIIFPLVKQKDRKRKIDDSERGKLKKAGNNRAVLVVEDEDFVRKLLVETLTFGGYRVFSASRVDEAIETFFEKKREIDLLITDMIMPGLSGKELAENLWSIKKDLKVVIISGYPEEVISEFKESKKKFYFVKKPFNSDELLRKIGEILKL